MSPSSIFPWCISTCINITNMRKCWSSKQENNGKKYIIQLLCAFSYLKRNFLFIIVMSCLLNTGYGISCIYVMNFIIINKWGQLGLNPPCEFSVFEHIFLFDIFYVNGVLPVPILYHTYIWQNTIVFVFSIRKKTRHNLI